MAVADLDPAKRDKVGEAFGLSRRYASDVELLADKDVEAVILATPSGLHAEQAIRALSAGKHVVIEKPMDVSLAACDRLIEAQKKYQRQVAVISQHRFDSASQLANGLMREGKLGRLVFVEMSVKWYRTQHYYDSGDWRGTWKLDGGGALMNQGVHTVDLMQWLAGPVKSVFAHTRTAGHERIEVEDLAVATLEFANGAVGTLMATTAFYKGQPARLDLVGTEGSLVIEGDRLKLVQLKSGEEFGREAAATHAMNVATGGTASVKDEAVARDAAAEVGAVWGDAHREQLRDFVRAVQSHSRPLIDAEEGRKPLEIILAVYESSRTGRKVVLSE